ncbi:MAG: universal stress protein [Chitinophagales bacterium]
MKKIIAAFDGLRFSESTMEYAIHIAQQCSAHLVAVFLSESTRLSYSLYAAMVKQTFAGSKLLDEIEKSDAVTMNNSIGGFEANCKNSKINYTLHRDKNSAVDDLIHETLFADLLIIDAWETFSYLEGKLPAWFIKNVLHDAQCPVLVVPNKFKPIEKLVFLYDGSPSSILAIKMFNYILPELSKLDTELLSAKSETLSMHLPDSKLMKEWMKRHSANATYKVMKGGERDIASILSNEDNKSLVVMGAYHRSHLSMWFHESLANVLMRETKAPIFIAHS